jgi:hypothetical protein
MSEMIAILKISHSFISRTYHTSTDRKLEPNYKTDVIGCTVPRGTIPNPRDPLASIVPRGTIYD